MEEVKVAKGAVEAAKEKGHRRYIYGIFRWSFYSIV